MAGFASLGSMSALANVSPIRRHVPQWNFADRARKVRRDLGLGQLEMAEKLGVGLKAYSAWESGKNSPEDIVSIAVKFEKASGVPRTWFLGWIDDDAASEGQRPTVGLEELESPTSSVKTRQLAIVTPLHKHVA